MIVIDRKYNGEYIVFMYVYQMIMKIFFKSKVNLSFQEV